MSDDYDPTASGGSGGDEGGAGGDAGREDLGTPISELFDLEIETGDEFLAGVRRRIERREMAASALDLSLVSAGQVAWNYLEMVLETLFGSRNGRGPGSPQNARRKKGS